MSAIKKIEASQILEGALTIVLQEGITALSVRKLAKALSISVSPIYQNFGNMDQLIQQVLKRLSKEMTQRLKDQLNSDLSPYQALGQVSIAFAKQYPALVKDLLWNGQYLARVQELNQDFIRDYLQQDPSFMNWTKAQTDCLLLKLHLFHKGILLHQVMNPDAQGLDELLIEVGHQLITGKSKKEKNNDNDYE